MPLPWGRESAPENLRGQLTGEDRPTGIPVGAMGMHRNGGSMPGG